MAKNHHQKMKPKAGVIAAAHGAESAPAAETQWTSHATQDEVAGLAYMYWQQRGCPDGSPEEDWFRAEADLRRRVLAAAV